MKCTVLGLLLLCGCGAASTEPGSPRPGRESACRLGIPHDRANPHVGLWVGGDDLYFLRYDGATVTMRWNGGTNLPPSCGYGRLGDLPRAGVFRFHAQEDDDGRLLVLKPCWGWSPIGRFDGPDRFLLSSEHPMRRVSGVDADDEWREPYLRCQEPYEAEGFHIP